MALGIIPAYGRDYNSAKAAKADWLAGKDFQIADMSSPDDGRYVSVREYKDRVQIRYKRLMNITFVN